MDSFFNLFGKTSQHDCKTTCAAHLVGKRDIFDNFREFKQAINSVILFAATFSATGKLCVERYNHKTGKMRPMKLFSAAMFGKQQKYPAFSQDNGW